MSITNENNNFLVTFIIRRDIFFETWISMDFPGVLGQSIWLVDSMDGRNLTQRLCTWKRDLKGPEVLCWPCFFQKKTAKKKARGNVFFVVAWKTVEFVCVCVCFFVGFSVFCLSASPVCWKFRESHGEACPATPSLLLRRPSVRPSKDVSYVDWWLAVGVCFTGLSVCLHSHLLARRYGETNEMCIIMQICYIFLWSLL